MTVESETAARPRLRRRHDPRRASSASRCLSHPAPHRRVLGDEAARRRGGPEAGGRRAGRVHRGGVGPRKRHRHGRSVREAGPADRGRDRRRQAARLCRRRRQARRGALQEGVRLEVDSARQDTDDRRHGLRPRVAHQADRHRDERHDPRRARADLARRPRFEVRPGARGASAVHDPAAAPARERPGRGHPDRRLQPRRPGGDAQDRDAQDGRAARRALHLLGRGLHRPRRGRAARHGRRPRDVRVEGDLRAARDEGDWLHAGRGAEEARRAHRAA